jgi:hypothetical protein
MAERLRSGNACGARDPSRSQRATTLVVLVGLSYKRSTFNFEVHRQIEHYRPIVERGAFPPSD